MLRRAARCNAAAIALILVAAALFPVQGQEALISPAMGGTTTATAVLGNSVGPPGRRLLSASTIRLPPLALLDGDLVLVRAVTITPSP